MYMLNTANSDNKTNLTILAVQCAISTATCVICRLSVVQREVTFHTSVVSLPFNSVLLTALFQHGRACCRRQNMSAFDKGGS